MAKILQFSTQTTLFIKLQHDLYKGVCLIIIHIMLANLSIYIIFKMELVSLHINIVLESSA